MATKSAPCLTSARNSGSTGSVLDLNRGLGDGSAKHASLTGLVYQPWLLRVGPTSLLIRRAVPRDLQAVAAMHSRCTAQTLLDRYRVGGRKPAVAAMERMLRRPLAFLASTNTGEIAAFGVAGIDPAHDRDAAELGVIVADAWQGKGVGRELVSHLAGAALVCGYTELIGYTATSMVPAQRLLTDVGRTRVVADPKSPHLHTYLAESAALGLGAVRERLAS